MEFCITWFLLQVDTNFNLSSVLMNGTAKDSSDGRKQCLAACKDQLNLVTETSSSFPNSQTFHRREEFCLILHKLSKTCASVKAAALTDTYPTLCEYIALMPQKSDYKDICPKGVWNPEVSKNRNSVVYMISFLYNWI